MGATIWTCAALAAWQWANAQRARSFHLIFRYQLLTPSFLLEKASRCIGKMTMLTVASSRGRTHTRKENKMRINQYISRDPCLRDQLGHVSRISIPVLALAMPPLNLDRGCSIAARIGWLHRPYGDVVFRIAVSENTHPSENESTPGQKIYSRMDHIIAGKERRKTGINPKHFIMDKNSDARDD
jgi:hypothetical protein